MEFKKSQFLKVPRLLNPNFFSSSILISKQGPVLFLSPKHSQISISQTKPCSQATRMICVSLFTGGLVYSKSLQISRRIEPGRAGPRDQTKLKKEKVGSASSRSWIIVPLLM